MTGTETAGNRTEIRNAIRRALGGVRPFSKLEPDLLDQLAHDCRLRTFARGEMVVNDGEGLDHGFVLVSGHLRHYMLTTQGRRLTLNDTVTPRAFALVAALGGDSHPGVIEAVEDSSVVEVPIDAIERAATACPNFALDLARHAAASSIRQTRLASELMFPVPMRLARLLWLSRDGNDTVRLSMPKAMLAETLGTIPETLSRAFSELHDRGLADVDGRTVRIVDPKGFREFAGL